MVVSYASNLYYYYKIYEGKIYIILKALGS